VPLRVKCRCGQEVVLRFNEWVYALFGLLVLSLLVNGTALVLLVLRLSSLEEARAAASPRPAPAARESREPGEKGGPGALAAAPAKSEPEDLPAKPPAEKEVPASEPGGKPATPEEPGKARAAGEAAAARAAERKDERRERLEPPWAPRSSQNGSQAKAARSTSPPAPREDARSGKRLLLEAHEPALGRVLAVARADDVKLLLLFLADEDREVRRIALGRARRAPLTGAPPHRDLLALVLPVLPEVLSAEGGGDLVQRLSGQELAKEPAAVRAWA